jgi:dolichyl-phosphate-mannose-protein mannosyltransferase
MKAWSGKMGILALLGLFLWTGICGAAGNLLQNRDFENGSTGWEQDVWNHGDTYSKLTVVSDIARSGGKSAFIDSIRENDAKWIQKVEVKPETLYKLSGWILAEKLGSGAKGANLSVLGSSDTSIDLIETNGEWMYVELYGRTGEKQKEMKVAARIGGYGSLNKGKAWFDDISLEEVDTAPAGVKVASFSEEKVAAGADGQETSSTTGTPFKLMGYALAFFLLYGAAYTVFFRRDIMERYSARQLKLAVLILLGAGLVVRLIIAPLTEGYTGDMNTFKAWATHAASGGLTHFYDTDMFVDYPPGYIYVLYVLGKLQSLLHLGMDSKGMLLLMKLPAMLADLATAWLLFRIAKTRVHPGAAFGAALLYVFNPAVIVNSTVWGQVDSFFTLFLLISLNAIAENKLEKAGGLFALAVLVKPQALIFTPVLLFAYWKAGSWKRLGKSAAWGIGVFLAGILPFSFVMKPFWFIELYSETLMSYPYATLNAFNLYALTIGNWKPQTDMLLMFKYQTWGTIFIFVAVALALYYFRRAKHHLSGLPYYIALVLISTMFLFGAKMHERYWFPALALVLAVFFHLKDRRLLGWFAGLSVCHFLNVAYTLSFHTAGTSVVPARDGVLLLVSFASLLLFGYLLKIGYDGFIKGRILPEYDPDTEKALRAEAVQDTLQGLKGGAPSWKLGFTRRDWILMAVLTLVYTVIAFYNLGSTKAPETVWEPAVSGESFYVDFGEVRQIERVNSYAEIGEGKLKVEFAKDSPDNWGTPLTVDVTYTKFFTWNVLKTEAAARYAKLTVETGGLALSELAFYEKDSEKSVSIASIHADRMTAPVRGTIDLLFDEPEDSHYHPTYLHGSYFDEIYHPRTAYEHIHNIKPYENTHPPLGKLIIAIGIKLFGMNPFGWRIMGTLFGIAMVPIMYVFGKMLFRKTEYAFMTSFLFTFDFMHFAQTRIATIDTYGVFFIILMYYYMYRYISLSFYRESLRKTLPPLFLSGLFFGIGAASKWIVLYGGAGLAVLFFASLFRRYREFEAAGDALKPGAVPGLPADEKTALERIRKLFVPSVVKTVLWCIPFFVIIPGIIYSASFIPYMLVPGEGFSFDHLIQYQKDMWDYHSKLVATHGFASPWWEWPFMVKPIWFYSGQSLLPEGQVSTIVSMGNPAVWWVGTLAVVAVIIMTWKRRDKGMIVVLTAFFSQYLPWMLVTRLTFIYHFFAMVPFIVLSLVYIFKVLNEERGMPRWVNKTYLGVTLGLFIVFYPVLSGMIVDKDFVRDILRWFGTWYFYSN